MTAVERHERLDAPPGPGASRTVGGMTAGGGWDGSTVGRYRLVSRLGEGGMGVVHLGIDPEGRTVAVKVLKAHIAADPDARLRLAREVTTLRRVRHPRVAEVLDADVDGAVPYLVTRFVPGRTLDDLVRERGPMPLERVVHTGRLLAEALRSIHASGVVHRDVKPANVMLVEGDPVVIDFGIAHVADESRITVTGLVMGTPGYLSPEVVAGHPVTEATDWWGWGGTLAFAAAGRPPFGTGPIEVVLDRVRRGAADLNGLDPRLQSVVSTALAADPDRRPPGDWLVGALEAVLTRRSSASQPTLVRPAAGTSAGTASDGTASKAPAVVQAHSQPPPSAARTVPHAAVAPTAAHRPTPTLAERPVLPADARRAAAPAPVAPAMRPGVPALRPDAAVVHPVGHPQNGARPARPSPSGPSPSAVQPNGVRPPAAPAGPAPPGRTLAPRTPVPSAPPAGGRDGAPPPDRATALLVGALVALMAMAAVAPGGAVVALLLWMVVARTADRSALAVWRRRYTHGPRSSDVPITVLAVPWRALLATLLSLLSMIVPLAVGASVSFIVGAALNNGSAALATPTEPVALGLAAGATAVTAWWGPGGGSMRRGTTWLGRLATRRRGLRIGVLVFFGFLVVAALIVAAQGSPPDFAPFEPAAGL